MGIGTCAINGLYNIVCRNAVTAAGGLNPENVDLHTDGFYRVERMELDDYESQDFDRRVQIDYVGTAEWIGLMGTYDQQRERRFGVLMRIGYFVGDHEADSHMIAADDDHAICKAIMLQANWPVGCTGGGCVNAYIPVGSGFVRVDEKRWVLEISITVQVTS